ncbi:MAG: hypothetical protein M9949_06090 [Candidatus Kapabacteria bacterium]|nr:hypothetical protein [Candidatus Kapabacteria bacterium]
MRKFLLTFAIFLLYSLTIFAKDGLDYTYVDFVGKKKAQVRESILKTESQELLDTLDKIIEGIILVKKQDKFKKKKLNAILKEYRERFEINKLYFEVAVESLKKKHFNQEVTRRLLDKEQRRLILPILTIEDNSTILITTQKDVETLIYKDPKYKLVVFLFWEMIGDVKTESVYVSDVSPDSTGKFVETFGYIDN